MSQVSVPHAVRGVAHGTHAPMIWVDGRRMKPEGPHLSALDRGFTLADGVFETMRVYDGVAFRLEGHLRRLRGATSRLGIPLRSDVADLVGGALADAAKSGMREAGLRVTVTRGIGLSGIAPPVSPEPTVVVAVFDAPVFAPHTYTDGLSVTMASGRRNEHAMTSGLKTLGFTDAVAALAEARAAGADDALFLDTEGHLSEGTSSNVFVHGDGVLLAPPLSCGALPGITRGAVIELASKLGIEIDERPIQADELRAAGEVFLTSSLRAIAPVVRVDGRPVGPGRPGPITRRVMAAYADLVRQPGRR